MKKYFLVLPAAILFTALNLAPSLAHTTLVASEPTANAVLDQLPRTIKLTFGEPLLVIEGKAVNYMTLHDPSGLELSLSEMRVDGATLAASLEKYESLQDDVQSLEGKYHLTYRVAGQDGHVINGELHFSVSANSDGEAEPTLTTEEKSSENSVSGVAETTLVSLIVAVALAMVFIYIRSGRERSS